MQASGGIRGEAEVLCRLPGCRALGQTAGEERSGAAEKRAVEMPDEPRSRLELLQAKQKEAETASHFEKQAAECEQKAANQKKLLEAIAKQQEELHNDLAHTECERDVALAKASEHREREKKLEQELKAASGKKRRKS